MLLFEMPLINLNYSKANNNCQQLVIFSFVERLTILSGQLEKIVMHQKENAHLHATQIILQTVSSTNSLIWRISSLPSDIYLLKYFIQNPTRLCNQKILYFILVHVKQTSIICSSLRHANLQSLSHASVSRLSITRDYFSSLQKCSDSINTYTINGSVAISSCKLLLIMFSFFYILQ